MIGGDGLPEELRLAAEVAQDSSVAALRDDLLGYVRAAAGRYSRG